MKKVLDENGKEISGLFRDNGGALIVKDHGSLLRHNKNMRKEAEFIMIKSQVEELKEMVKTLQNMIINTTNKSG